MLAFFMSIAVLAGSATSADVGPEFILRFSTWPPTTAEDQSELSKLDLLKTHPGADVRGHINRSGQIEFIVTFKPAEKVSRTLESPIPSDDSIWPHLRNAFPEVKITILSGRVQVIGYSDRVDAFESLLNVLGSRDKKRQP